MPIIKFYGVENSAIEHLSSDIDNLASLINASPSAINYIHIDSTSFCNSSTKQKMYIEIDWLSRPTKLREVMVEYLLKNLKIQDNEVCINFNDINNNYYVDGILKN